MNHLFWGLVFVLLNYKITVGSAVVEILPDFIGFFLLMRGMEQLAQESLRFDRGRHWAFGMGIVSILLFGADLADPDTATKIWLWAASLAALAVTLGMVRNVIRGMTDMGKNTERLRGMWLILAVMLPICYLVNWIPMVGSICQVAACVIAGVFLAVFITTK